MKTPTELMAAPDIAELLYAVRDQRVIFDTDLAALYSVETFRFNEAVKRNLAGFPADFIFRLSREEWSAVRALRSQNAILKSGQGSHRKYLPYASGAAASPSQAANRLPRQGRRDSLSHQ